MEVSILLIILLNKLLGIKLLQNTKLQNFAFTFIGSMVAILYEQNASMAK